MLKLCIPQSSPSYVSRSAARGNEIVEEMKKVGPPGATYNFLAVDAMLMKNVVAAVFFV